MGRDPRLWAFSRSYFPVEAAVIVARGSSCSPTNVPLFIVSGRFYPCLDNCFTVLECLCDLLALGLSLEFLVDGQVLVNGILNLSFFLLNLCRISCPTIASAESTLCGGSDIDALVSLRKREGTGWLFLHRTVRFRRFCPSPSAE